MKKLLFALLCMLLCLLHCSALAEDELTIVHVTDTHYLSPALTDYGETFMELIEDGDGKVTHYTPQLMAAFVDEMLALQPDAIILSGDLTFNGASQSHTDLVALLTPLADAGIQLLALPGNHDTNSTGYRFEGQDVYYAQSMADEEFDDAYAQLGYAEAISRDAVSMSYVAPISPDVWALLVDVNANGTAGTVKEETFSWIEEQLIKAKEAGATVITVSHQPVLIHNSLFTFSYVINNNTRLLALYEKYQVPLNLCGHLHMQHIAQSGGLVEIAASSLAVSPNQYGVLRLQGNRLMDYRMQPVDVASWAVRTEQTDPNLLSFVGYSSDFFDQTTRGQAASMFADSQLSQEEQDQMVDFAVRLNAEYFSGKRTITEDDPAWAMWQEHMPGAFFTYYMRSILTEQPQDMTRCSFQAATE